MSQASKGQQMSVGEGWRGWDQLVGRIAARLHSCCMVRPVTLPNVPAWHGVGEAARLLQKPPSGHSLHAVCPVADWNFPLEHWVHSTDLFVFE